MMVFNDSMTVSTQSSKKGGGALRQAQDKPSPLNITVFTLLSRFFYAQ